MDEIFLLFLFSVKNKTKKKLQLSFCIFRWFSLRYLDNIQDTIMNMPCGLISS